MSKIQTDHGNLNFAILSALGLTFINQAKLGTVKTATDELLPGVRFGGGLSHKAPLVQAKFSFQCSHHGPDHLKDSLKEHDEEETWKSLGAYSVEISDSKTIVRFIRPQAREQALASVPVVVRLGSEEIQIGKTKDGRVAVFC
jgi:hypothetical protein